MSNIVSFDEFKKKNKANLPVEENKNMGSSQVVSFQDFKVRNTAQGNLKNSPEAKFYNYLTQPKQVETAQDKRNTWFNTGAKGNILQKTAGTVGDIGLNVVKGIAGAGEKLGDLASYGVAGVADILGAKDYAKNVRESAQVNLVGNALQPVTNQVNQYSLTGDKLDSIVQSVGESYAMSKVGSALGKTKVAQKVGLGDALNKSVKLGKLNINIPLMSVLTGASSGITEAYQKGGDNQQAFIRGITSGLAEGISEGIFGVFGQGGSSFEQEVMYKATKKIENELARRLTKLGITAAGEGAEEGISYAFNYVADNLQDIVNTSLGKEINKMGDKWDWNEFGENILSGAIAGGISAGAEGLFSGKGAVILENTQHQVENKLNRALTDAELVTLEDVTRNQLNNGKINIDQIVNRLQNPTVEDLVQQQSIKSDTTPQLDSGLQQQLQLPTQNFTVDTSGYSGTQLQTYQNAINSGLLNNNKNTHDFVDFVSRISKDKGIVFNFTNNQALQDRNINAQINGFIDNNGITLNVDSNMALEKVIGHEITHTLENMVNEYNSLKNSFKTLLGEEYNTRLEQIKELYSGIEGANYENELISDLAGEYLFTNEEFINRLSTEKPSLFRRIYEEIKYLWKMATGTEQEKQLARTMRIYEQAYRNAGKVSNYNVDNFAQKTQKAQETQTTPQETKPEIKKYPNLTEEEAKEYEFLDSLPFDLTGEDLQTYERLQRKMEGKPNLPTRKDIQFKDIARDYGKYKDLEGYNAELTKDAESLVPDRQGRRTKEQWLDVASFIGERFKGTDEQLKKYAIQSWLAERPNNKDRLNRQGKGYVKFTIEEWLNKIYESANRTKPITQYSLTENKNGEPELTLYHGTSLNAAFKIQKYGLLPNSAIGANGGEANYNYFTNSKINAESYRDRKDRYSGQLLRVKKTDDMLVDDRIVGHKKGEYDFRTQRNVTPDEIQILTNTGYWTPITNYDLYTDTPEEQKVIDKSLLYDDNGNKVGDVKYSLTKASNKQVEEAEKLENKNKTAEDIFLETGAYRGADGRWRTEIDDSNAKIKLDKPYEFNMTSFKLEDILDHPELYKAYPEFRDLEVVIGDLPETYNGFVDEDGKIYIDNSTYDTQQQTLEKLEKRYRDYQTESGKEIGKLLFGESFDEELKRLQKQISNFDYKTYQKELKSTLLHEIQHEIQEKEGFTKGTNTGHTQEVHDRYMSHIRELNGELSELYEKSGIGTQWVEENMPRVLAGDITIDQFFEEQKNARLKSPVGSLIRTRLEEKEEYENRYGVYERDAYDLYKNTAGEIEAREVQKRMNMTPEERKLNLPFVKDEKTIYQEPSLQRKYGVVKYSLSQDNQGRELTKDQQEFFKDSKARDENGELLTMYHSTPENFTIFDKTKLGENTGYNNTDFGFFVTPSKAFSERFKDVDNKGIKGNTMELYANIKKPIIHPFGAGAKFEGEELDNIVRNYLTETDNLEGLKQLEEQVKLNDDGSTLYDLYRYLAYYEGALENSKQEREILEKKGYDAVEFIEGEESSIVEGSKNNDIVSSYAVFNSNQIKNVDNLNPTNNPDIRYSLSQQNPNLPKGQFRGKDVRRDTNIPTTQENALNVPLNRQKRVLNPTEISNLNPEDANTTPILPTTRTLQGDKQSRFLNNINQTEMLTQESKDLINNADIGQYRSVTNEESLKDASQKLSKGGKAETERWFRNDSKNVNATDIAEGFILLNQYQELARNATNAADKYQANQSMVEVAKKLRQIGTEAGQTLQAYSILSRMTPEGMVYYAQSELTDAYNEMVKNKSRQWIEQHREDFELTPEETQFILDTMNEVSTMEDGYEKKVKLAEIQKLMTDKLPPAKGQKIKSWMRLSMLFNPKTQVRNVAGNTLIVPVNSFSDIFASYADKLISRKTGKRTTGTTNIKAMLEGFKKGAYEATTDYKKGINTRDIEGNRFEIGEGKSFSDKSMIGKALNNTEGLLNYVMDAGDRVFSEAAFENSLQNQMKLNNTTEVTQDMIDIARQEALSRTWNDNNNYTKFVLNVRSMLNKINFGAYGLGDVLIPFAKTPANLTKAIVDYSPVGFVNTLLKGNKLSRSLENGQYTPQLQHDFVQTLGKATAGTMLYILGTALAKAGITSGESDDDKDTQNFLKNTLGISNYSIKIGNKSFTYDWAQPIAAPLSITANIEGRKDKEQALGEAILSNLDTASSVLLEQSFMQGINEVLNNNGKIVDGMLNQVLELPARAVPTLSKQIVDLTDSTQRTSYEYNKPVESAINAVKAKIPGLSQTLAPVVDTMGREVQRYGGKNNLFNVFLNPANVNTENISEAASEIYEVYKATGDKTIMPRVAPYYINQKGEKITLNSKQKAEFQTISGSIIEENMNDLINNQAYQNLNDTEKASMINDLVNYAYNKARKDVLNIDMSNTYNKINEFIKDGGTPAEYYTSKEEIDYAYANPNKYSTIRQITTYNMYQTYNNAIKDIKTKYSTSDERKNAIINYVNGLELGIPQKAMLIRMNYSSFKQYDNLIIDYINSQDLTVEQKSDILKEIGFTIKNGVVYN